MAATETNGTPSCNPDDFLDEIVDFPDGSRFERLKPITDFRKDPGEARILYMCKRIDPEEKSSSEELLVMKVKAQWPGPQNLIHAGPSPLTSAELKVLQLFRDQKIECVPHLLTWKKATQPHDGVHPGGYVIYTVMTLLPGQTLWDLGYWGMTDNERDVIKDIFMKKLREIRALGIAPFDCALRNILWDRQRKQVSIVDFEHYEERTDEINDEKSELQRWGLVQRPPPRTWFQEWGLKGV